ncbi:MAG TPA: Gfo/Idh/MocA family oxidoreductase [Chloroflexota bacterium]|nr:Gfo/Idh/MocA family oxidoreductase [Chloroflexota bacterium]
MIRVGFVGTGNISHRHFTALGKLREQAEVVAVCDVIEERVNAAAQPFGAKAYLSFPEMLAREKLDALYVCLPPDAHVDQEIAAIDRGIHLFAEKPLPLDLAKAAYIARRAREAGVVTSVGYHWRHWEHVKQVRAALRDERVGMALGYFLNALPGSPWWRVKVRSGGQVVEQAIHIVDLSRYLLGEVERVSAEYSVRANFDEPGHASDDVYTVNLRFRNGAIGNLSTCSILHRRFNVGLDVLCKRRAYRIHEDATEVDEPDGVRRIERSNDAGLAENVAFLQAIATGDRSGILSDYQDALRTQRVVIAANRSAETGAPVSLPDEG